MLNQRLIMGIVCGATVLLAGCKRYTYVLSPHAKRLAISRVLPEHADAKQEKDGVQVLVQKVPDDAVKAVFGTQKPVTGYALTVTNDSKKTVELNRAQVDVPGLPNDYVFQKLAVHVTLRESQVSVGPLFAAAVGVGTSVFVVLSTCVACPAALHGGFACLLAAFPVAVIASWITYGVIVAYDANQEPECIEQFLQTIVLEKVKIQPRSTQTRLIFTPRPVKIMTVVLTRSGTQQQQTTFVLPLAGH